jgi:UPF0755 protein
MSIFVPYKHPITYKGFTEQSLFEQTDINMSKKRNWIMASIGGVVALGAVAALTGWHAFMGHPIPTAEPTYIYIDRDDTPDSVRCKIIEAAQPSSLLGYDLLTAYDGYAGKMHTGRYKLESSDDWRHIYQRLRTGRQAPLRYTLPSVRTLDRLAEHVGQQLMMDAQELMSLLSDSAFVDSLGYTRETLPALFLPNTYELYWDATPREFVARMQKEHATYWNAERKALADSIGLTPVEVTTLASIVEEETANTAEKPVVAGLYMNRLHRGMRLQADPTVKFAVGDFGLKRILHAHLTTDSPYNTYLHEGLPPGPIRIPSLKGIEAVLHYARHTYIYMCAKEDFSGTHNFATTDREHLDNARRYQKALNARGIK